MSVIVRKKIYEIPTSSTGGGGGGGSTPYTVYDAIVTQTGTNAPVSTIFQNTLGFTPVWFRASAGNYELRQTGGFPVGKTAVFINMAFNNTFGGVYSLIYHPHLPDKVTILTSNFIGSGTAIDDNTWWMNIRVYP